MGSSLPKQLVTQTHTSSLSPAALPGFFNTSDSWECQITPPPTPPTQNSWNNSEPRPSGGEKLQYKKGW